MTNKIARDQASSEFIGRPKEKHRLTPVMLKELVKLLMLLSLVVVVVMVRKFPN